MILRGGVGLFYDRPFGNSVISMAGNPPSSRLVTVRYGQLQSLGQGGLTTQGAPGLNTIDYEAKLPVVDAVERRHPDGDSVGDDARRGVGRPAQLQHRPHGEHQHGRSRLGVPAAEPEPDPGEHDAWRRGAVERSDAVVSRLRRDQHAAVQRLAHVPLPPDVGEAPVPRTACRSASTTRGSSTITRSPAPRLQHAADGSWSDRDDQDQANDMLAAVNSATSRSSRGTSCGICPTCTPAARR